MHNVTFITGNQSKADYLAKYLGFTVNHKNLELDEVQSLDLDIVVKHKVHQAYELLKSPVLVEDVALEFKAFGRLPGTFIKFFIEELSFEQICRMLDGLDRSATARCTFGFYDGQDLQLFEGHLDGKIAEKPSGSKGYGWDQIFIPKGYEVTRASLSEADDQKTYTQIKPFDKLKAFLETR